MLYCALGQIFFFNKSLFTFFFILILLWIRFEENWQQMYSLLHESYRQANCFTNVNSFLPNVLSFSHVDSSSISTSLFIAVDSQYRQDIMVCILGHQGQLQDSVDQLLHADAGLLFKKKDTSRSSPFSLNYSSASIHLECGYLELLSCFFKV